MSIVAVFLVVFLAQASGFVINTAAVQKRLETDPAFRALYEQHMKKFEQRGPGDGIGYPFFNCTGGISATVPTNVNSLRPGDIRIVAAMGDSWTAANGAGATNIAEMALTYRGKAALAGGEQAVEQRMTVPNVIKKFNPRLFGYSNGTGPGIEWKVGYLNTAEPGNKAHHLPTQAYELLRRMRAHDGDINMANDWKLINLFIGGNDLCGYCGDPVGMGPESFIRHIIDTLTILRLNIPRALVNVVGVPHIETIRKVDQHHPFCAALHADSECKCLYDRNFTDADLGAVTDAMNRKWDELVRNGTFDTTDDFSLIVQPTLNDIVDPPRLPNGDVDMSYFTPDCFHLHGKGHSNWAFATWQNMMEPVGRKTTTWEYGMDPFITCPDPACPFIRTSKNTANCQRYLTPAKDASK